MKIVSELGRSILVGVMGTVLNLVLLYFFKEYLAAYYLFGATLANTVTMFSIFIADRCYTFKHGSGKIQIQFMKYLGVYLLSNASSVGLLAFFVEVFGWYYLVAQAIATTLVSFMTFLVLKYWIFRSYVWR